MNIEQLTLDCAPELVTTPRRGTPEEQWEAAVAANPCQPGHAVEADVRRP